MSERPNKRQKRVHNIFIDDQAGHSDSGSDEDGEQSYLLQQIHVLTSQQILWMKLNQMVLLNRWSIIENFNTFLTWKAKNTGKGSWHVQRGGVAQVE